MSEKENEVLGPTEEEHENTIVDYAELFKGKDGLWYVRTKSNNGQTIMTSEGYKNRGYAMSLACESASRVKFMSGSAVILVDPEYVKSLSDKERCQMFGTEESDA